jgi:hypothetical protein
VLMRFALKNYYASPIYADMPTASMTEMGRSKLSDKVSD